MCKFTDLTRSLKTFRCYSNKCIFFTKQGEENSDLPGGFKELLKVIVACVRHFTLLNTFQDPAEGQRGNNQCCIIVSTRTNTCPKDAPVNMKYFHQQAGRIFLLSDFQLSLVSSCSSSHVSSPCRGGFCSSFLQHRLGPHLQWQHGSL